MMRGCERGFPSLSLYICMSTVVTERVTDRQTDASSRHLLHTKEIARHVVDETKERGTFAYFGSLGGRAHLADGWW